MNVLYDGANELTSWGGTGLTYDANGNMTRDQNRNSYTWGPKPVTGTCEEIGQNISESVLFDQR